MEKAAGLPGSFVGDPVFEPMFDWERAPETMLNLSSSLLDGELVDAMNSPPSALRAYRFDSKWRPYVHQVSAWKALKDTPPRSVIVTSGTGSGKTECFLVPILDELVRESRSQGQLVGVRALFLYPLNALINSQRDRLRAWSARFGGRVRFCLYNGDTPETAKRSLQAEAPEQVLSRDVLRSAPTPILVTNGTMLEYMLVRSADRAIVDQSLGRLRWIVLDEAHTYIGSQAAELSLLLRRVLNAFRVNNEDVHFIATSATIGSAGDPEARSRLQRFLADVAGLPLERVVVVEGSRSLPPISEVAGSSREPIIPESLQQLSPTERFARVSSDVRCRKIRRALFDSGALTLSDITKLYAGEKESSNKQARTETLALLDSCASARSAEGEFFLPMRAHIFHRTQGGLWACCNPACLGRKGTVLDDPSWAFGQVFVERHERCSQCDALVFEITLCVECGEEYLPAEEHMTGDGRYFVQPRVQIRDEDDFELDIESDEESDEDQESEKEGMIVPQLRLLERRSVTPRNRLTFDPHSGQIFPEKSGVEAEIQLPDPESGFRCHRCGNKASKRREEILRPMREGAAFLLGVAIPAILERVAPDSRGSAEKPFGGRRLLTFSDSRQGTARFALRAELESERNYMRSLIYHQVVSARRGATRAEIEGARKVVADLEKAVETYPALESTLRQKRLELERAETPGSGYIPWRELVEALQKTSEIRVWMQSLRENLPREKQSASDVAHFCLLRELMRRPKRQNSLETLGLVKVDYDFIEKINKSILPAEWKARGLSLQQWRDFLKIAVDFVVRGRSAVDVPQDFLNWMGSPIRTRFVVGPKAEAPARRAHRWPSVTGPGVRSRIVAAMLVALGLNIDDEGDRALLDHLLLEAWTQVQGSLKQFQDGRQLVLQDHVIVRQVINAWFCPITRRVLDTTLLGHTPYATAAFDYEATKCSVIQLPQLPFPFQLKETGEAVSVAEFGRWLEEDPQVQANRELGVWTEFSDRIASFASYFRVGEHSAQQSGNRLRELERLFKDGELNVLSCSTTMEMGVDIGGLSAVAMNNAPPSPSNYLQRAGRAGRRGENVALGLTLCQSSPHAEAVFADPLWPFRQKPYVSKVSLQNERIVRRHANAMVLSHFLKVLTSDLHALTAGWFFENVDNEGPSPVDIFLRWSEGPGTADHSLADGLRFLVRGTSMEGVEPTAILGRVGEQMRSLRDQWNIELGSLKEELAESGFTGTSDKMTPVQLAINSQLERISGEYLLKELTARAFLPGHGFPTNIVPFVPTTMADFARTTRRRLIGERAEREDNLGRRRGYPSRDIAMAIREYGPGCRVVLDGRIYDSKGVTLNWKIPAGDHEVRELQAFRHAWRCRSCGRSGAKPQRVEECPLCSSTKIEQHEYCSRPVSRWTSETFRIMTCPTVHTYR